jgi:Tol biopolymer transport system component
VWTVPVDEAGRAGPAARLTSGAGSDYFPKWSPDGAVIAFRRDRGDAQEVWLASADGGGAERALTRAAHAGALAWFRGGDALLVWGAGGAPGFWRVPLEASAPSPLTLAGVGSSALLQTFDLSRDGRYLAYAQTERRGDVWLLDPAGPPARR